MATPATPPRLIARLGNTLSLGFLLVLIVTMAASGWVAFYEGTHRFLLPFTTGNAAQVITDAAATARAHPTEANIRKVSEEIWALSRLVPVQQFAQSKLLEQGIYYAQMPRLNQALLAGHVLLSVFCVSLGSLQFWPGFRRRFMLAHRRIGMIYVFTAPLAVLIAFAYMALTAPYHIYANLVAWLALWLFGSLALGAIFMAMRALRARRLHEHQSWMALSFGCLLVAPLLRLDWVLLAPFFPGIDQETLNVVTMGMMLPETMLITYGLILVNRQYRRPMRQRPVPAISQRGGDFFRRAVPALYGLSAVFFAVNVILFIVGRGSTGIPAATGLVPAAFMQREHAALGAQPWMTALFVASLSLAFPFAVNSLKRQFSGQAGRSALDDLTPSLTLIAGLCACHIGWQTGLSPANAQFSGGTLYTANGLVICAFSLLLFGTQRAQQQALSKECLIFLLCLLPFPTLFLATLGVMHLLPLAPVYRAAGQGFIIPVGVSSGLLLAAMMYVIYGQATREHN